MFYRCTAGVLQVFCRCTVDVLHMFCKCTADVLQVYCRCATSVLQMCCRHTTDVWTCQDEVHADSSHRKVLVAFFNVSITIHSTKASLTRSLSNLPFFIHRHLPTPLDLCIKSTNHPIEHADSRLQQTSLYAPFHTYKTVYT